MLLGSLGSLSGHVGEDLGLRSCAWTVPGIRGRHFIEYMYVCMYVCMYECMYVYMDMYIHADIADSGEL